MRLGGLTDPQQAMWDPTTPFTQALGPLGPGSGVNVLALRTCKADVIVGLPDGKYKELCGPDKNRMSFWYGKWALIQFSKGS